MGSANINGEKKFVFDYIERNAGAIASPAVVPPRRPSRPGTTHHQGSGRIGAITFSRGISIENGLRILITCSRSEYR